MTRHVKHATDALAGGSARSVVQKRGSESAGESATGGKQRQTKVALVLAPGLSDCSLWILLLQRNARVKLCFSGPEQGMRLYKRPAL